MTTSSQRIAEMAEAMLIALTAHANRYDESFIHKQADLAGIRCEALGETGNDAPDTDAKVATMEQVRRIGMMVADAVYGHRVSHCDVHASIAAAKNGFLPDSVDAEIVDAMIAHVLGAKGGA